MSGNSGKFLTTDGSGLSWGAVSIGSSDWGSITGKPTTILGYGITDAFSGSYSDLTNKPTLFTGAYADLTGKPTTIAGYGITDAFNGTFTNLTGKPTTIAGYGITDAFGGSAADIIAGLGFTPENIANKSTSTALGTSDTLYPTQNAVKTYIDNNALGLNWRTPLQAINVIANADTPVGSTVEGDAYIVRNGANTGVWSAFSPGDIVQYQYGAWVKIKSLVMGDRFGIAIKSTTTPAGLFTGFNNYTFAVTGGTPGAYTFTGTAPANGDARYIVNPLSSYYGISFTYSGTLAEWVQLSSRVNESFSGGINFTSNVVSLDATLPSTVQNNITALGTIATGVWHGTAVGALYGGTNQTTYATGDMLFAGAPDTLATLAIGTAGQVLTVAGGVPTWATPAFSGAYADLTGKPTLFDGAFGSLTGKPITIAGYGITDALKTTNNLSDLTNAVTARTNLGLGTLATQSGTYSGTSSGTNTGDVTIGTANGLSLSGQAVSLGLASAGVTGALSGTNWNTFNGKEPAITAGTTAQYYRGDKTFQTLDKTAVGLGNVENAALSTWAGSTNIVTLGTVTTGTWNATAIAIAKGGTGQTTKAAAFDALSPLTTLGDILYGGAAGTGTRLAGAAGFLKSTGSAAPTWSAVSLTADVSGVLPIANGGTNGTASPTNGGVAYGTGTAYAFSAAGTSGQFLKSVGAGTPVWASPSIVKRTTIDRCIGVQAGPVTCPFSAATATLQNDPDMVIAIGANEIIEVDGYINATNGNATPDIKIAFTIPSGATMNIGSNAGDSGASTLTANIFTVSGAASSLIPITAGGSVGILFRGIVVNGSTVGNIQVQWAQNTLDATTGRQTIVKANSYIKGTLVP